jgi:hypothetical protein
VQKTIERHLPTAQFEALKAAEQSLEEMKEANCTYIVRYIDPAYLIGMIASCVGCYVGLYAK